MMHQLNIGTTRYFLKLGDIIDQETEAIVNAANSDLAGGGGVDGAIHRAGGSQIAEECRLIREKLGKCPPGKAVLTSGGKLKSKFVIHTVGPFWTGGNRNEASILRDCYINSLALAREHRIKSLSFPSISTGAYRFPIQKASEVAQLTLWEEIRESNFFTEMGFVLFDEQSYNTYFNTLLYYL